MVTTTTETGTQEGVGGEPPAPSSSSPRHRGRRRPTHGGLRRLISSTMRVMDVQYRIMMLRAKMTLMRMAMYVGLMAVAVVLGLVGVIFLYIGVFRLLTDLAGLPVWATFLIYAGVHVLTAMILIWGGARALSGRDDDDAKPGEGKK
jgi:hypothetical protein